MPERAARVKQHAGRKRKSSTARLYGRRWQAWSKAHLVSEPLCRICASREITTEASVTDHIVPHRGDERLFWDEDNLQSLCKPCHDHKTLIENQ